MEGARPIYSLNSTPGGVSALPGVKIGDWRESDALLILASCEISAPEVKTTFVEIPAGDGSIDYTDYFGEPKYKNRTIKLTFLYLGKWPERFTAESAMRNAIHGQRLPIRLDGDDGYYWLGRVSVGPWQYYKGAAKVAVTCTVEPYKLRERVTEIKATLTNEQTAIYLPNDRRTACPDITTTDSVTLVYDGKTVMHNAGEGWKLADLLIPAGGRSVSVTGAGTITFSYQEAGL